MKSPSSATRSEGGVRFIDITNPHQRRHFDFFHAMNHPHWSICADVEIGPWLTMARAEGFKITPAIVHLLARAANDVPQLCRRIRGDRVVEHEVVHPTFSVATDVAEAFSFCHVPYDADLAAFVDCAARNMERVRIDPVFEDEAGRDDYLFMSALPWISFTSIQHAMHYHPHDSVPRISWGKFRGVGGRVTMPLSLQSHHALVDGVHAAQFFQGVERLVADVAAVGKAAQTEEKAAQTEEKAAPTGQKAASQ